MAIIKQFELLYCSNYKDPQGSKIESFGEFAMHLLEHNAITVSGNQSFRLPDVVPSGLFTDERLRGNIFLSAVTNPYAAALQAIEPYMDVVKVTTERALNNCYIVAYANADAWLYTSIVPGSLGSWVLSAHYNGMYSMSTPFILRYNFMGTEYATIQTSLDSYVVESENGVITNFLGEYNNLLDTSGSVLTFIANPSNVQNAIDFLNSVESHVDPDADTDPYSGIDGQGALPGGADVDLPAEPTLSALDAGLFALFSPSASQMRSLASFLWTDFGGTGTDVVQVLGEVVEALKRTVSNPLNSMLGLSIIASQGLSKGGSSNVHVGFWDTGVAMTRLAKQYFTVDCGSISFNPVCGDTFLDYAPYSKFSIFLPYVGTKELDANDVVGHTLSVKYRGDCVTGSLVCYLKRDGTIIAEFSGNCALNLPLTADSWGQTLAGAGAIVAGGVRGAITGSATAAGGAVKAAASVATNPSVFSSQVTYTGAVSGGAGHMGSQKPFILREAVRFHSTSHFNSVIGYPAFYYRKLGDCSGYTQVLDVHLHNTPCTGVELKEIEDLLKEGVII